MCLKRCILSNMKKIKATILSLPMRIQYTILITIAIVLLISSVITVNYAHNKDNMINTQIKNESAILALELENVEQYIRDLISFSVQTRFDTRFMRLIESNTALPEQEIEYLKEVMKGNYYTRNDLLSLGLYMQNQNMYIGRDYKKQHFNVLEQVSLNEEDKNAFLECNNSDYYMCILPSDREDTLCTFYHSIIQIDNRSSNAIIKADIKKTVVNKLLTSPLENGKFAVICYDNKLLFSGNSRLINSDNVLPEASDFAEGYSYITLQHEKYLVNYAKGNSYNVSIMSFTPYSAVTANLRELMWLSLLQGIIVFVIAFIVLYYLSRLVTSPLATLSDELEYVGKGNFGVPIDIKGSREISELSDSFNNMTIHIDELIKENYIVKLNEQSARLIALEAQMNPHFLYNTLQAISSEALTQNQPQIYEMITNLASILRYTVKGGDIVTLSEEMVHVKQYIALQKIRLNEHMTFSLDIATETQLLHIPKISIQTLVENAIIHGISGETSSIHINILSKIENDRMKIIVSDNGQGMNSEQLSKLYESFEQSISSIATVGIGLANLNSRLKILFDKGAGLTIHSSYGKGTTVIMELPIQQ